MNKPNYMPRCCGVESTWVDNVPGKEYAFCSSCRKEVGASEPSYGEPIYIDDGDYSFSGMIRFNTSEQVNALMGVAKSTSITKKGSCL